MPRGRGTSDEEPVSRRVPSTDQGREDQMVSAAIDLVEKQLREGTASAAVITHYLKLGSSREKLEQQRLSNENILLEARREALESEKRSELRYQEVLTALRTYQGIAPEDDEAGDDYDEDGYY